MNLRNPLHASGIYPGFETQGKRQQKSKTGVSVAPQKGLTSSEIKKKWTSLFVCIEIIERNIKSLVGTHSFLLVVSGIMCKFNITNVENLRFV